MPVQKYILKCIQFNKVYCIMFKVSKSNHCTLYTNTTNSHGYAIYKDKCYWNRHICRHHWLSFVEPNSKSTAGEWFSTTLRFISRIFRLLHILLSVYKCTVWNTHPYTMVATHTVNDAFFARKTILSPLVTTHILKWRFFQFNTNNKYDIFALIAAMAAYITLLYKKIAHHFLFCRSRFKIIVGNNARYSQ